jgi:hypothetical protein
MGARDLVAKGHRLEELSTSRAPLLILLGFLLLVVPAALRSKGPSNPIAAYAGLAGMFAGAALAWMRLTNPGRALVAAPTLAWGVAFALGSRGATAAAQTVGVVAAVLSVIAVFFVVQTRGFRTGRLRREVVRTHRDAGPAECRLTEDGITLVFDGEETASHPLAELGPPRLEMRGGECDLVVVDVFGDPLLHLRARGTEQAEERAAMRAVAEELWRRLGAQGGPARRSGGEEAEAAAHTAGAASAADADAEADAVGEPRGGGDDRARPR